MKCELFAQYSRHMTKCSLMITYGLCSMMMGWSISNTGEILTMRFCDVMNSSNWAITAVFDGKQCYSASFCGVPVSTIRCLACPSLSSNHGHIIPGSRFDAAAAGNHWLILHGWVLFYKFVAYLSQWKVWLLNCDASSESVWIVQNIRKRLEMIYFSNHIWEKRLLWTAWYRRNKQREATKAASA